MGKKGVFERRQDRYSLEKRLIAAHTVEFLNKKYPSPALAIDGGTTNLLIARTLCNQSNEGDEPAAESIVTNSHAIVDIVKQLVADHEFPTVDAIGGILRQSRATFIGEKALKALETYFFSVAIVGANAFFPPDIFTTTTYEHPIKKAMIRAATLAVIFPMDSSKWGETAMTRLIRLTDVVVGGKRAYIVAAYPLQDYHRRPESEGDQEYLNRVEKFVENIARLIDSWPFQMQLLLTHVECSKDTGTCSRIRQSVVDDPKSRALDMIHNHAGKIPVGSEKESGLVLTFELFEDRFP